MIATGEVMYGDSMDQDMDEYYGGA